MNEVGINREKWLPNPAIGELGLTTSMHAEMLEFLGRLMGVAVRSQEPLDLDLPSIVWKQLVRSPITRYLAVCIFAPLQRIVSWLVRRFSWKTRQAAGRGCCRREGAWVEQQRNILTPSVVKFSV